MSFELVRFIFWFALAFAVLLALAWLAGWNLGSSPARPPLRRNHKQAGVSAVESLAAIAGVAGAFLLATKVHPAFGFGAFLLSNVGWLAFSCSRRHWGLFGQQLFFLASSLIGLWNWWLGPLVLD